MADVRIDWDEAAIHALAGSEFVRQQLGDEGGQVARRAAGAAPKRTGAGARSIHGETVLVAGAWEERISWDQLHAYMRFPDLGTKYIPGTHFLERALDRYARP